LRVVTQWIHRSKTRTVCTWDRNVHAAKHMRNIMYKICTRRQKQNVNTKFQAWQRAWQIIKQQSNHSFKSSTGWDRILQMQSNMAAATLYNVYRRWDAHILAERMRASLNTQESQNLKQINLIFGMRGPLVRIRKQLLMTWAWNQWQMYMARSAHHQATEESVRRIFARIEGTWHISQIKSILAGWRAVCREKGEDSKDQERQKSELLGLQLKLNLDELSEITRRQKILIQHAWDILHQRFKVASKARRLNAAKVQGNLRNKLLTWRLIVYEQKRVTDIRVKIACRRQKLAVATSWEYWYARHVICVRFTRVSNGVIRHCVRKETSYAWMSWHMYLVELRGCRVKIVKIVSMCSNARSAKAYACWLQYSIEHATLHLKTARILRQMLHANVVVALATWQVLVHSQQQRMLAAARIVMQGLHTSKVGIWDKWVEEVMRNQKLKRIAVCRMRRVVYTALLTWAVNVEAAASSMLDFSSKVCQKWHINSMMKAFWAWQQAVVRRFSNTLCPPRKVMWKWVRVTQIIETRMVVLRSESWIRWGEFIVHAAQQRATEQMVCNIFARIERSWDCTFMLAVLHDWKDLAVSEEELRLEEKALQRETLDISPRLDMDGLTTSTKRQRWLIHKSWTAWYDDHRRLGKILTFSNRTSSSWKHRVKFCSWDTWNIRVSQKKAYQVDTARKAHAAEIGTLKEELNRNTLAIHAHRAEKQALLISSERCSKRNVTISKCVNRLISRHAQQVSLRVVLMQWQDYISSKRVARRARFLRLRKRCTTTFCTWRRCTHDVICLRGIGVRSTVSRGQHLQILLHVMMCWHMVCCHEHRLRLFAVLFLRHWMQGAQKWVMAKWKRQWQLHKILLRSATKLVLRWQLKCIAPALHCWQERAHQHKCWHRTADLCRAKKMHQSAPHGLSASTIHAAHIPASTDSYRRDSIHLCTN